MANGESKSFRLSLSGWIVLAFAVGIATGLFFGESTAFLQIPATGFIRLLQMAVLPYVTVSLIAGLGSLSYREAGFLARQGGAVLLLLWGLTFAVIAAIPLAYPEVQAASFFSTTLVEPPGEFDFIGLYIPANPFHSLSENAVPAVVLFCIALGVALIGVQGRETLIENFHVLSRALGRITSFVIRLTPIGVFAIAASAAGTMTIGEFDRLQVYVVTYVLASLFLVFWIMPGLIAALTPLHYRDVVRLSRDALVTAFSTGSTFVVLPLLADTTKELLQDLEMPEDSEAVVDVIVPVSFNFPNAGRLFALTFVLFAGWYEGSAISLGEYPMLAVTGLFSLFSNVNVALPFLLDLFRIPADMFQLFVAVGIVESRFATLLAAMHILALTLLGTCAVSGVLRIHWGRIGRYLAVSVGLGALVLSGASGLLRYTFDTGYQKSVLVTERSLSQPPVAFVLRTEIPDDMTPQTREGSRLDRIRETGVLRVGYGRRPQVPFSYLNDRAELVGFDIDMAHRLAADMGVTIEFVPFDLLKLAEHLEAGHFDIPMTGMAIAAERSQEVASSIPYMDMTFAFIVKDHRREEFATRESVRRLEAPRIAVPPSPYYREKIREYAPDAEQIPMTSLDDFGDMEDDVDAAAFVAEAASAWTLLYPEFTVVVPQPDPFRVPMAYFVSRGDQELVNFVNDWLELKRRDNTLDELYRYWILGRDEENQEPRWSIIRDVLHWVD